MELWIISDSQYSISCITEWFDGWKREKGKYYNKSGKEVKNIFDFIKNLKVRDVKKILVLGLKSRYSAVAKRNIENSV